MDSREYIFNLLKEFKICKNNKYNQILEILGEINPTIIDINKTNIINFNTYIILNLFSKNEICCPLNIIFGLSDNNKNKFDLYFNNLGQIIYDESVIDDDIFKLIKKHVYELLKTQVEEKQTIINNNVVKAIYYYYIHIDNKLIKQKYTGIDRVYWPWEKKDIKRNCYDPWLE